MELCTRFITKIFLRSAVTLLAESCKTCFTSCKLSECKAAHLHQTTTWDAVAKEKIGSLSNLFYQKSDLSAK